MTKLYAVIDTNVLVSALLRWDSLPGAVMEQALMGGIIPVLSDEIIEEYREVLARKKFCFSFKGFCSNAA
ncbi:putative toxin-antitoxin system toxin component, PIN family [Lachnospiraceae bacterium oral taxon 500]|nr:putative toxin-antitoxin system toxin component, PIN family [Lachnospiraceae bacterium oral taxon 500]